jgi:hypothetical protein
MIRVEIGNSERTLEEASERWINQQVDRRRRDGVPVCVRVHIQKRERDVDFTLITADCPHTGSGERRLSIEEQEIFRLWNRLGLGDPDFTGNQLVAFLKQIR